MFSWRLKNAFVDQFKHLFKFEINEMGAVCTI